MGEGYQVRPVELAGAAQGVRDVLGQLGQVAGPGQVGWVHQGRGTAMLGPGAGPIGHTGLGEAFAAFCARWEWGVRAAIRTGQDMADGLSASAQAYEQGEDGSTSLLERIAADVMGDPSGASSPATETAQDWRHTADDAAATWSATAQDVWANSTPGMIQGMVAGENPLQGQLDDVVGLASVGSRARIGS